MDSSNGKRNFRFGSEAKGEEGGIKGGLIRRLTGLFGRRRETEVELEPFTIGPPAPAMKAAVPDEEKRGSLLYMAFKNKRFEFSERGVLSDREMVELMYSNIQDFQRLMDAMGMDKARPEEERLRAKSEDRENAIADVEGIVRGVRFGERTEALALIAGMAERMRKSLCSKEVCARIGVCRTNLDGAGGDRMAMLREIAAFLEENGAKPSGKNMRSEVPRAEAREMDRWLEGRPDCAREMAEGVRANGKPESLGAFMRMLEEDPGEPGEKRLYVGERVLGRDLGSDEFRILSERVPGNVAYYCINDILRATSIADAIGDEEKRNRAKMDAVDAIMSVVKRMPEGRGMDAPRIVADLAKMLLDEGRPAQWIVTGWLAELTAYMIEPDRERAFNKLLRLKVKGVPMEVLGQ